MNNLASPEAKPVSLGRRRSTAKRNDSELSKEDRMPTRQQLRNQKLNKNLFSKSLEVRESSSSEEESSEGAFDFVRGKVSKELGRRQAERPAMRNKT